MLCKAMKREANKTANVFRTDGKLCQPRGQMLQTLFPIFSICSIKITRLANLLLQFSWSSSPIRQFVSVQIHFLLISNLTVTVA